MEAEPATTAVFQWLAAVAAIAVALLGGYVAHNDFGISFNEIRIGAAIGASTIITLLVIEYFARKLRKSK